jgi:hypothetical protein
VEPPLPLPPEPDPEPEPEPEPPIVIPMGVSGKVDVNMFGPARLSEGETTFDELLPNPPPVPLLGAELDDELEFVEGELPFGVLLSEGLVEAPEDGPELEELGVEVDEPDMFNAAFWICCWYCANAWVPHSGRATMKVASEARS